MRIQLQVNITYDFLGKIWKHSSEGAWFFISLPEGMSREIRENLIGQEEGWGRMKVQAKVKDMEWATAIWFDRKRGTYLLPIKAEIRKKAGLGVGDTVTVRLFI